MGHGISERSLDHLLGRRADERRSFFQMARESFQFLVETLDLGAEIVKNPAIIISTFKMSHRISQDTVHMGQNPVRGSHLFAGLKIGERRGGPAKCFLRTVSERTEKVAKKVALYFLFFRQAGHQAPFFRMLRILALTEAVSSFIAVSKSCLTSARYSGKA